MRRFKWVADIAIKVEDRGILPHISLEAVEAGTQRLQNPTGLPEVTASQPGVASAAPGDVLFGKLRPYLAKSWLVDRNVYASTELLCIRPRGHVHSRWLSYVVSSQPFVQWAVATSDGTKMPRTSWEKLRNFNVDVPAVNTQRLIADYLDRETARIDALIAAKRRMLALLRERDQIVLSQSAVPLGSSFASLRRFARIQSGLTIDGGRNVGTDSVTSPYLRVANVQAGRLDLADVTEVSVSRASASRATLQIGDVLMTEGGDIDKLGRGTVWRGEIPGCLHQNHIFAVRTHSTALDPSYLALLTQSNHSRAYFEKVGVQSTNLASISASNILHLPVPVIPVAAQREIVSRWNVYSAEAVRLQSALDTQAALLLEHRQALITAAVTGQLDISKSEAAVPG